MKVLIIHMSVDHGNTEKVGRAMAEVLSADVRKASEVDLPSLAGYDMIGFGSGIFYGKFHARLVKLVDELPELKAKAFVFSTGGYGKRSINEQMIEQLKSKGFDVMGDFACKGWDTYKLFKWFGGINKGRPNESDLENARRFAKGLLGK